MSVNMKKLALTLVGITGLLAAAGVPNIVFAVDSPTSSFVCTKPLALEQAQSAAKKTEQDYRSLTTLTAQFVQVSYFAGLEKQERSQGKLRFLKPGRMDWDYAAPEPQRFVSDGDTLWYYQPAMNQVTLANFREAFSSDLPVSFLLGIGSLSKAFDVKSGCVTSRGTLLTLTPKESDPSLADFKLLISAKDFRPVGAKIADVGGNETTIELFEIENTQNLVPASFHFDVPRGVDVIDKRDSQRRLAGASKKSSEKPAEPTRPIQEKDIAEDLEAN